jgi:uncharacterized OB-fold protein
MSSSFLVEDPLIERLTPELDALSTPFWTLGALGALHIGRCASCGYYNHPPTAWCARCLSRDIAPAPVSGQGIVLSFTVNHQQWVPGQAPFVLAVVGLREQDGLRLTTNIVGCTPQEVAIGMRVEVRFIHRNDVYYPVFVPAPARNLKS